MTGVRALCGYIRIVEDGYNLFCIKFRMKSEPRVAKRALYSNLHGFLDEDLLPHGVYNAMVFEQPFMSK